MKNIKRIIVWSILSICIQFAGLLYVNNYLLSDGGEVKAKKVTEDVKPEKKNIDINVPATAKNITLSYDGKYLAFYEGDVLEVTNTKTGELKKVEFDQDIKVSYYKWLPDRNRMLIAEKKSGSSGGNIKLSYYDVDKAEKADSTDLTWADSKSEVVDIKVSTLTNVIYVKVAHSGNRSSIYRINIMHDMKKVDIKGYVIGNMEVIPHEDKLVYEDLTYNTILATNVKNPLSVKGAQKLTLLGIDGEDTIYLGQLDANKVSKIYQGTIKDPVEKWKVTSLKAPVDKKDITISSDGDILVNDNLKGIVTDVASGKEISYTGKFLEIYNSGIASISQGKLYKTELK